MKTSISYAFQLLRIFIVSANRIHTLLVCIPRTKVAESVGRSGQLRILWLVGLALSSAYYAYFTMQLWKRTSTGLFQGTATKAAGCECRQYCTEPWYSLRI
jgi:hypothetical protein